jgi:hypothetical protein
LITFSAISNPSPTTIPTPKRCGKGAKKKRLNRRYLIERWRMIFEKSFFSYDSFKK